MAKVFDLSNLDSDDGFIIAGDVKNESAGGSVSGAGDVNGDGLGDLIVGALAGEASVIYGKPMRLDLRGNALANTLRGDDNGDVLRGRGGV